MKQNKDTKKNKQEKRRKCINHTKNISRLSQQRDNIRAVNPAYDRSESMISRIQHLVNEHKLTKWLEHLERCSLFPKKL